MPARIESRGTIRPRCVRRYRWFPAGRSRHFRSAATNTRRRRRPAWSNRRDLRPRRHERTEATLRALRKAVADGFQEMRHRCGPGSTYIPTGRYSETSAAFSGRRGGFGQRETTLRRRRAGWRLRAATISPALHGIESARARLQTEAVAVARSSARKRIRRPVPPARPRARNPVRAGASFPAAVPVFRLIPRARRFRQVAPACDCPARRSESDLLRVRHLPRWIQERSRARRQRSRFLAR